MVVFTSQSCACLLTLQPDVNQVKQREAAFAASGEKEAARAVARSCDDFLRQMGYREYSRYLSFHFPFTHERSLLEHLRACPWKWNQSHFKVCCTSASCHTLSSSVCEAIPLREAVPLRA